MTTARKLFIAVIGLMATNQTMAEAQFNVRAIAGFIDYEINTQADFFLDLDFTAEIGEDNLADRMGFVGLGGTIIFDGWFVDANYIQSGTGDQAPQNDIAFSLERFGNTKFDRSELVLSLGKNYKNFSFALGYKDNETDFFQTSTPRSDFGLDSQIRNRLAYNGLFISAGAGLPAGNGVISVNAAYADLDGDFEQNYLFRAGGSDDIAFSYLYSGDADGLSLGIKWVAPITKSLSYSLGYDYYDFSFDIAAGSEVTSSAPNAEPVTFNVRTPASLDEKIQTIKLELNYMF